MSSVANDDWTPPQPPEVETTGKRLASEASELGADLVLIWNQVEDAVLGHIVARELGVGIAYANEVEGILDTCGALAGCRVLVVFAETPKDSDITALTGLIATSGASLAGILEPGRVLATD
ncbi:hypothetical protein DFO66_12150 [Brevibacterium sanguinis]|uniref:Uncharacterized protein n=2 Tax=Brevibacterium TaxID=1696 RepID=A0A366IFL4_9MICO|nr:MULTISPECIES: hypothetical protein [Brevibacterium]RBP61516.1 hypothetical protein DFO66_12150 [Brevibacterium sanguinis]RBP68610.1 hypothetical protein DFO65_11734 [Brevibacterium celere]